MGNRAMSFQDDLIAATRTLAAQSLSRELQDIGRDLDILQGDRVMSVKEIASSHYGQQGVQKLAGERHIEWCVKQPPQQLSFLGTTCDDTAKALVIAFGKFPIQLSRFEHEAVLVGMAAAAGEGRAPYNTLLEAVRKYTDIEVRLA